jgi:hypothetical protein
MAIFHTILVICASMVLLMLNEIAYPGEGVILGNE